MTKSPHIALKDLDLELEQAWSVYLGEKRYRIDERVEVLPIGDLRALEDHKDRDIC